MWDVGFGMLFDVRNSTFGIHYFRELEGGKVGKWEGTQCSELILKSGQRLRCGVLGVRRRMLSQFFIRNSAFIICYFISSGISGLEVGSWRSKIVFVNLTSFSKIRT